MSLCLLFFATLGHAMFRHSRTGNTNRISFGCVLFRRDFTHTSLCVAQGLGHPRQENGTSAESGCGWRDEELELSRCRSLLCPSWKPPGLSWASLDPLGLSWGPLMALLVPFGSLLGPSWRPLGLSRGPLRTLLL